MVRTDLTLPQQLVQAAHAALEAGIHLPQDAAADPSSLVVCAVTSEAELLQQAERLRAAGIQLTVFREPDLADQATALCTQPLAGDARRPCRRFTLWRHPETA